VKVSKDGNVYLTGFFDNTLKAGDKTFSSAGSTDIFLACYDKILIYLGLKNGEGQEAIR